MKTTRMLAGWAGTDALAAGQESPAGVTKPFRLGITGQYFMSKISSDKRRVMTDKIIKRMNALAVAMDSECAATHPSAWDDLTKDMKEEWLRLNRKLNSL